MAECPRRREWLHLFKNVVLQDPTYPACTVYPGGSVYDERVMSIPSAIQDAAAAAATEVAAVPTVRGAAAGSYFFFIFNLDNYYHFVYDTLPYLVWYEEVLNSAPSCRLLLPAGHTLLPFQRETFALLGITEDHLCWAEEGVAYEALYVPSSFTHGKRATDGSSASDLPPSPRAYAIWQRLSNIVTKRSCHRRIYISRRSWVHGDTSNIGTNYTTRRRCMNEDALVALLKERGYEEIFMECLTMSEKIQLMGEVSHVVGCIGGGMANLLFADPETRAACIPTPEFLRINARFVHAMDHTQITYLPCASLADHEGPYPLYVRVRLSDGRVGEVDAWEGGCLVVKVPAAGTVVAGFAADGTFETVRVDPETVEALDGGLNSLFVCDLEAVRAWADQN